MAEVRTLREGSLWWVQGSGSGTTWATASAPASGLFGYVNSFNFSSGQTVTTISDRGTPTHHKITERAPISISVEFMWTGYTPYASGIVSASGSTVNHFHLEHRATDGENGGTGRYHQFHGVLPENLDTTEQTEGNTVSMSLMALAMNGPTASGYIT